MNIVRIVGAAAAVIVATLQPSAPARSQVQSLSASQVDEVIDHLQAGLQNYVLADIAARLQSEIREHRAQYRTLHDPAALAERLTADLRAVGHDHHLQVVYGEELAMQREPTADEQQHAHAFDFASGYGVRSARRLPGNIGYVDLAYFSPDPDAGAAIAALMQLVSGTDALILDLRRNGGGSGDTATSLLSYFFEQPTQLSSIVEHVDGRVRERQKWTMPYTQGPRYTGKPVFILTSSHTHSAAELCAYDLKNSHRAILVGERTSGDANSSSGMIDLGYGFSTLIPNGQTRSPITNGNWEGTGVQPDVISSPAEALVTAYGRALSEAKAAVNSDELASERAAALKDPEAALLQEIDGFPQAVNH
jgi:hypothetical protein